MRNVKSMLLTLVCAAIILGLGYLGIVEQGKQILRSESVPEQAMYEDAGSNIFYGKIEDDIEIFPWNYYPENPVKEQEANVPIFLGEDLFIQQYFPQRVSDVQDWEKWGQVEAAAATSIPGVQTGQILDRQLQCFLSTDAYFSELIACEAGVGMEEVFDWFQVRRRHILQNMVMTENVSVGTIYFYRNILYLGGKRYQVRIACSDWNVINFTCSEYVTGEHKEQDEWKEGKQKMVEILEQSETSFSKYFSYMSQLNDMGSPTIYVHNGEYENAYLYGLLWLQNIVQGKMEDEELAERFQVLEEEWKSIYQDNVEFDSVKDVGYSVNYSYQVVELKDMILLLVQGEAAMGLYFDPMTQKFCGYNFFYEY